MKLTTILLSLVLLAFWSCSDTEKSQTQAIEEPVPQGDTLVAIEQEPVQALPVSPKAPKKTKPIDLINKLIERHREPVQTFTVPSKAPSEVEGKYGSILYVNPSNLETVDGSPLGDEIQIKLREVMDRKSLVLNNAPTVSNGKLLVSGGAYFIELSSSNTALKLSEGQTFKVEFPKVTQEKMDVFYGEKDSRGSINWVESGASFKTKQLKKPAKPKEPSAPIAALVPKETDRNSDSTLVITGADSIKVLAYQKADEEYKAQQKAYQKSIKTYTGVELTSLGWINCDRFLRSGVPLTNVSLNFDKTGIDVARFILVFEDINSAMNSYFTPKTTLPTRAFLSIPINREVKLLALALRGKQALIFTSSFTIEKDQEIIIEFEEASDKAIGVELSQIGNFGSGTFERF